MLYKLFLALSDDISALNVFRYLTFRGILAAFTAMSIWFLAGPWYIRKIKEYQIQQFIREEGPESHKKKSGTPTMGGLMLLATAFFSCLLWADLGKPMVWLVLVSTLAFAAIGFHDDFLKIKRRHNKGLSSRQKLLAQILIGSAVGTYLYLDPNFAPTLTIPFLKEVELNLGIFYIPFAALVLVGTSNAVNLTDGLDGLAIGPVVMASMTYMVFCYCAGNLKFAQYLQIAHVPGASEITLVLAAIVGAGLGFLWFNTYPAQIFMGDVGSLSLGALLGLVALIAKQELLLVVVGGIFVMEALSVIMQVGFFKATGGRRIFRMAPLHHHFELKGWPEPKVIVRFWIIASILGLIGLSTLKLR